MKRSLLGTVSAFVLAGAVVPVVAPPAEAQMTMHFSAPFISNSGIVGAAAERHFFTVAVTGFPLESLMITLPNDMRVLEGAVVTNQMGQEIPTDVEIGNGNLTIAFPQPVEPDDYLTVELSGVKMDRTGGTVLYRVSAMKQGLTGPVPIGSANVRLPINESTTHASSLRG